MIKRIILPALALAMAATACAADLDSLCRAVAVKSPALRAERANADAERLQGEVDNSLAGPEVDFDYKFNHNGGENRWGVSVGQAFDWPGVYAARGKSNRLRSGAFEQLYRQNVIDKALELKLAAIRLAQARENLKIITEAHDNFTALAASLKRSYDRGEATILALRKSELQLMAVRTSLVDAESELAAAEAALEAVEPGCLADFKAVAGLEIKPLQAREVYEAAMASSPGMDSRRIEAEAMRNDISVARRAALPSFKLSYAHDYEDGTHFNGFGIGISLPSWQPRKAVRLAEARAVAAEFGVTDYGIVLKARLSADYSEAARLYSRISDECEVLAGDYPALLKKAYEAGIFTVFEYLTEYNSYLDTIAAHNALLARYATLEASLAKYLD